MIVLAFPSRALANGFYEGKTVRFIVGYAPGGGYDTCTRAIARHIREVHACLMDNGLKNLS